MSQKNRFTASRPIKANLPKISAAWNRGPGPGKYKLPSCCGYYGHDPTKTTMPQYSIGKKIDTSAMEDCSPGPIYFIASKMTRHGLDGIPMYSIAGKGKNRSIFNTPSPSAYYTEKVQPLRGKSAPAYSMGLKTLFRKRNDNPSPNAYTLPSLLGTNVPNKPSSAAYSLATKSYTGIFSVDLAKSPGPSRYNPVAHSVYAHKAPAYSMAGRCYMPGDSTKSPGPAAHDAEKVTVHKPSAPSFSLGIRHSEFVTPLIIEVPD